VGSDGSLVVLVHGAWGSPGLWHLVRARLEERGVETAVVDLPTMRSAGATFDDDVEEVRSLIGDRDVVLGAHSYGGMVATAVANDAPGVRHVVYLSAIVPAAGESAFELVTRREIEGAAPLEMSEDGTAMVTRWGDPDIDSEQALALLDANPPRPFAIAAALAPAAAGLRPGVSSTYVLTTQDTVVHPDTQREMAVRTGRVVELECDHLPQGEHPDVIADLLADAAG
jgi:pimeloyl-ACP methyl ester carboxylesterase